MISPFERMYAKPNTNTASRITDAVSARSTIDLSARHAFNERISIGIIPQSLSIRNYQKTIGPSSCLAS